MFKDVTAVRKKWILVVLLLVPVIFAGTRFGLIKSYSYALNAHAKGDFATAFPIVYVNAVFNDAAACALLGTMYLFGQGVERDGREAEYWLTRAADRDSTSAQYLLGIMYATGQGVPVDKFKAQTWLNRAASAGDVEATNMLHRLFPGSKI